MVELLPKWVNSCNAVNKVFPLGTQLHSVIVKDEFGSQLSVGKSCAQQTCQQIQSPPCHQTLIVATKQCI